MYNCKLGFNEVSSKYVLDTKVLDHISYFPHMAANISFPSLSTSQQEYTWFHILLLLNWLFIDCLTSHYPHLQLKEAINLNIHQQHYIG